MVRLLYFTIAFRGLSAISPLAAILFSTMRDDTFRETHVFDGMCILIPFQRTIYNEF